MAPHPVPRSRYSSWFWLIGKSCPSHLAQPFGAQLKLITRSSAMNGSLIPRVLGAERGRCGGRRRRRGLVAGAVGLVLHVLGAVLREGREAGVAAEEVA